MRLFRERYDRAEDDPRRTPGQRVKIAAELLRAAHGPTTSTRTASTTRSSEYRVLISADQESRFYGRGVPQRCCLNRWGSSTKSRNSNPLDGHSRSA